MTVLLPRFNALRGCGQRGRESVRHRASPLSFRCIIYLLSINSCVLTYFITLRKLHLLDHVRMACCRSTPPLVQAIFWHFG